MLLSNARATFVLQCGRIPPASFSPVSYTHLNIAGLVTGFQCVILLDCRRQMQRLLESWSLSRPLLPPRSQLYSLEPMGVGTELVESLTGYVARLADAHSVSVGDLVGRVLADLTHTKDAIITQTAKAVRVGGHGFRACNYTPNGVTETAVKWVDAIEAATNRNDLQYLTLLPLRYMVPGGLFRRRRAWCALCFEQWRSAGQIVYEPVSYTHLEPTTPRHGDRPFEIGHIDHTELDVEVVCSHTGRPLGRPWMTVLIDAFSRRCLAFYLTFDAPSYRSCMMILRDCVRRHSRLPQVIVLDGGPEFQSTYFETLLARYECTKKVRPPAQARFGSVCERLFGTTNSQFIHNLRGNTQITRNVRQVTKSNEPTGQARWPLGRLYEYLSSFLFEIYDTIEHPALGQTPREAFLKARQSTGIRPNRTIPYDHAFLLATLPTTQRGTANVSPGRGVIINRVYYWAEAFRDPTVENHDVSVRYDPFDIGTAYAFVKNRWTECHSEHYTVLQGRSERCV